MFFKNKFGYTDILYFMRFFGNIADNGKGIAEGRATATESGEVDRTLAKNFTIF